MIDSGDQTPWCLIPGDSQHLRLLAALFALPQSDSINVLQEIAPRAPWLIPAIDELLTVPLDQWQAEYTQLFIAGYPQTPCPPFAAVYGQAQLNDRISAELRALYDRAGLQLPATVAPDYLGVLFDCAAYLIDLAREQNADGQLAQQLLVTLWEKYLLTWLPQFAVDLQRHAKLQLYQLLGERVGQLFPNQTRPDQC
ncbi:TorD/DmsD family molecular chaperone [Thiospirillum jenense]|uniref:Molecular chaperone TorD family protein n=1 Tax=Thiospirillum jenense TaxID=1653858 RepID=A0A839H6E0_9GAMM|nr:molecular chaperone TorD family protein [Thiospirillum jenense]MBB1125363.1 molecular chaperone TorD family protein [Thiospirillum jenense]